MSVLASDEIKRTAALIARRLGRPLEPFDIWYAGFRADGRPSEVELDRLVTQRFPTPAAFKDALPTTLRGFGFAPEKAAFLADRIVIDAARGSGHAMGAVRREDKAHLRTRVAAGGMDYKGYNIALHELGHNVEQVFSLNEVDHWSLSGVPDHGVHRGVRDGLSSSATWSCSALPTRPALAPTSRRSTELWATYEIGGVSLVDSRVWHWLYDHPGATPAQLRDAVLGAARDVWNLYYAPVFGVSDSDILAVYSHMISYPLYLLDYPLGHIIAFQIAATAARRRLRRRVRADGSPGAADPGRLDARRRRRHRSRRNRCSTPPAPRSRTRSDIRPAPPAGCHPEERSDEGSRRAARAALVTLEQAFVTPRRMRGNRRPGPAYT